MATERRHLWREGVFSSAVLTGVAAMLAAMTRTPFSRVWPAFMTTVLFCTALGLLWLTLWARMKNARLGQFGIASMLFLTAFASMFFSAVRWFALAHQPNPTGQIAPGQFIAYSLAGGVLVVILTPYALRLTDSLLWASVYLLRCLRSRRKS